MVVISEKEIDMLNDIAQEAGEFLLTRYGEEPEIIQKGEHDFTTNTDKKSQRLIITRAKELSLPYTLVAEEKLDDIKLPLRLGDSGVLYIYPLEGTHNFARKRNEFGFGVTLGLVRNGYPVYVVFYNPVREELYKAVRGGGAFLNGERIHVSDRKTDLDIVFNHWPDRKYVGRYLDKLRRVTEYTPTSVSDAVDIWMVARGSVDGLVYIYKKAEAWDLINAMGIEEAGGKVTNKNGNAWYTIDGHDFMRVGRSMIAGNQYVHQLVLNTIGTTLY